MANDIANDLKLLLTAKLRGDREHFKGHVADMSTYQW